MEGLTAGRMVHYVLGDGHYKGEHRPAIVVKLVPPEWGYPEEDHAVQLQVFMDGTNDGEQYANGLMWATSVKYSEDPKPYTWHWIERA